MSEENKLSHVKPGDKLYYKSREWSLCGLRHIPYKVFTVTRLTAIQIVTRDTYGREARFRIKDGVMIGESPFRIAEVPTSEMIAAQVKAIQVRNAQSKMQDMIDDMRGLGGNRDQYDDFWLAIGKAIENFENNEKAQSKE